VCKTCRHSTNFLDFFFCFSKCNKNGDTCKKDVTLVTIARKFKNNLNNEMFQILSKMGKTK
jgi:hypothetical protein